KAEPCGLWNEWFTKIGDDATYVERDPLNSVSYSYKFLKNGQTVRHIWATTNTAVLINGSQVILTPTPIYVHGAATVALDPNAEVLLASVTGDFTLAGQGQPWDYRYRNNSDTGETAMSVATDHWEGTGGSRIGSGGYQQPAIAVKPVLRWTAP